MTVTRRIDEMNDSEIQLVAKLKIRDFSVKMDESTFIKHPVYVLRSI